MNNPLDLLPGAAGVGAAVHVLVVAGVANVALAFLLGWVLSAQRLRAPIEKHRWLLTAHEVALQEGLMMLGLAFAMYFTRLPEGWPSAAAWLLVVGGAFQVGSGVVNWLRRTNDQFAERSAGWVLATINALLNTAGLGIVVVGILRALR